MKAAVMHGPGDLRIEEVETPVPDDGEVVLKVRYCGVCGSDVSYYRGRLKLDRPTIKGHEISGDITAIGPCVARARVGDRVVVQPNFSCGKCYLCKAGKLNICRQRLTVGREVRGGFAEFVKVPEEYAWGFPAGLGYDIAALTEPYTIGLHACERAKVKVGDKVAVLGAGPIGLCVLQMAKIAGAEVCVVDLVKHRLELAHKLGADRTIDASREEVVQAVTAWSGVGASATIEAVGVPEAAEQAIQMVRPGGRVVFLGSCEQPIRISPRYLLRNEIEITGSLICLDDFPRVLALLTTGRLDASALITHHLALDRIDEGFRLMVAGAGMKILVQCG